MNYNQKSLKITIIVSVILVGMASCAAIKFIHTANPLMSMTPQEKQEIKNKANKATIEYFKKEKILMLLLQILNFQVNWAD